MRISRKYRRECDGAHSHVSGICVCSSGCRRAVYGAGHHTGSNGRGLLQHSAFLIMLPLEPGRVS